MRIAPHFLVLLVTLLFTMATLPLAAQVVTSTVAVQFDPATLAVNSTTNKIYVANECGNDPNCGGMGTVTVIDGSSLATHTISVSDYPYGVAVNATTNKIYVGTCASDPSCSTNGSVTVIDGSTLATQDVTAGIDPSFVAVNASTNKIYVANLGCNFFPCDTQGTVTVIDGSTLTTQSVTVGYVPVGIAINASTNKIYVVNQCGADVNCSSPGTVTVIDGTTLTTQTVNVDYIPNFAAVNTTTNKIYVANNEGQNDDGNGSVTVIDGATLSTSRVNVGVFPVPLVVNPNTNKIYVGNRCGSDPNCINPPSISVINGSTLSVTTVPVCKMETYTGDYMDIDLTRNKVYVACNGRTNQDTPGLSTTQLNGSTNATTPIAVGDFPNAVAVNPATNRAYVANSGDGTVSVIGGSTKLQLVNVTPCRVVDTRNPMGPFGGPAIPGGSSRSFAIPQGACHISSQAAAYSLNVTVVPHHALGYLTIWPTSEFQPTVSTLNSTDGRVKANAAIVPAGVSGAVSVYAHDTTDVILDIDAYFAPSGSSTYEFYKLPPCRLVDTRNNQQGGTLQGGVERDYTIPGNCGIPTTATAYSFNVTVLPTRGELDYLTVWPKGQSRPTVSTLNDPTGTIVANAAIVPAGNQNATAFYANDNPTDLLVDVNGYFAPAGSGGLSMYPTAPCRVLDTRNVGTGQPFRGVWNSPNGVDVVDSPCAPGSTSKAFVFNATVVPSGQMPFLTLWPHGTPQPEVSTLNAYDGFITSNMAIVPTNDESINAYADGLTQLILDISGYFAP